jgi:hypothetical protein
MLVEQFESNAQGLVIILLLRNQHYCKRCTLYTIEAGLHLVARYIRADTLDRYSYMLSLVIS